MDTKQIEYIIKITEENNITRAAEKLFITQSALNQQLLKLEKELGTPLFYRSRTNWHLTEAGEVYVENARKILHIKKQTYDRISDITNIRKGTLRIGFTPGRGINMFGAVYPNFHHAYPNVIVEPVEQNVKHLQEMISNGQLDIAFLTLNESDKVNNEYVPLFKEEIFLLIPECHPLSAHAAPPGEPFTVIDPKLVQHEPFVLMDKYSTMRKLVNQILDEFDCTPNILFETKNHATIMTMIRANICCAMIPEYYIKHGHDGITCFALPTHPTWEVCASYKKGGYLSHAAKHFIELAKEYWT